MSVSSICCAPPARSPPSCSAHAGQRLCRRRRRRRARAEAAAVSGPAPWAGRRCCWDGCCMPVFATAGRCSSLCSFAWQGSRWPTARCRRCQPDRRPAPWCLASHPSCGHPLARPRSLELNLERDLAAFCSQECFKGSWAEHKKLHKPSAVDGWHYCTRRGQGRSLNMPDFKWTGDLRPARIGPMRPVSRREAAAVCVHACCRRGEGLCVMPM